MLLFVLIMLIAAAFGIGALESEHVRAEAQTIQTTEIASYVHRNKASGSFSSGYDTETANFKLLWGDITNPTALNDFAASSNESVYKYDGTNKIDCFFYYSGSNAGKISAGQQGYETVVKVTAKANVVVTTKHAAFTTTANNLKISTILKIGSTYLTAQSNNCGAGSTAIAENAYSGSYHLAAGDELFFVVGSTNTYTIRLNALAPSFVVATDGYSAETNKGYVTTNVGMNEIAQYVYTNRDSSYTAGYDAADANFKLLWGDINSPDLLNTFTQSNGESVYKYDGGKKINCFFYYSGTNAGKISAGQQGYETVIKVTAKANVVVTTKHAAFTTTANNLKISTILKIGYTYLTAQSNNCGAGSTAIAENAYSGSYHLAAGDELLFVVGSTNTYAITNNAINASFDISGDGYLESVRNSYVKATLGFASIATAYISNNKADYTGVVTAGFRYGTSLSELNRFTANPEYCAENIYKYDGNDNHNTNFFFRHAGTNAGTVNAGANAKSVVWMQATVDCKIVVTMPAVTVAQNNVIVGLAVADGEGNIVTLLDYEVYVEDAVIPAMNETLSLKEGEQLFWYVGSRNEYYANMVKANPSFSVDATAYDEDANAALFDENKKQVKFNNSYYMNETTRESGSYVLPSAKKIASIGAEFIGWSAGETLYKAGAEMCLSEDVNYTANFLNVEMFEGASIRLDNPTGMRWGTQLSKFDYDKLISLTNVTVETGTLITPTDYLAGGVEMSFEGLDNAASLANKKTKYLNVVNEGFANLEKAEAQGVYTYYGAIVEILENNYFRKFSAVGYVKLTIDGVESVIYGDYSASAHSRSVYEVAFDAYNDRNAEETEKYVHLIEGMYSPYSKDQLKVMKDYIDGVVNLTVSDTTATAIEGTYYEAAYTATYSDGVYTVSSTAKICTLVVNGNVTAFTRVDEKNVTFPLAE